MQSRTAKKKTNKTVLFAVEGDTEYAFLTHLKQCYLVRESNVSIKVKNAHGAGPLGVVDALVSGSRGKSFDMQAALFDSDLPVCEKSKKYFDQYDVRLFQSVPAIEGTLLRVGDVRLKLGVTTEECKRLLARNFAGDAMDVRFYERHFSKGVMDAGRPKIKLVDDLIAYILNPK